MGPTEIEISTILTQFVLSLSLITLFYWIGWEVGQWLARRRKIRQKTTKIMQDVCKDIDLT